MIFASCKSTCSSAEIEEVRRQERWAERKAGREFACTAEASFFLGRFGPFAAMPKGLGLAAAMSGKDNRVLKLS